jgi:Zn-finger nucleic acid-binding protein
MSRDAKARNCPACVGMLFESPERAGTFGCATCGGIWADNDTSQLVAAVMDPELVDLADRAATFVARNSGGPLPHDKPRSCPECGGALVRVNTASTNLDVCTAHGTWFDRGELQRVSRKLDADRDRQIPYAAKPGQWVAGRTAMNGATQPEEAGSGAVVDAVAEVAVNVAIESAFIFFSALLTGAAKRDD